MKVKSTEKLVLLLLQGIIMAAAFLFWLLNRGNAFQKTFSLDEFITADSTIVIQDVTTDATMSQGGVFLETPALSLKRGVYQIEISYNADRPDSTISVSSAALGEDQLHCTDARLNPNLHHVTMVLELTKAAEDVVISANFSGNGYLSITNVGVYETSAVYKRTLFYAFLFCLLLTLIYRFIRSSKEVKGVILVLASIFAISSYLLFNNLLFYGDDLFYHLLRIEGIQKGLSMGIFPVKIHPVWALDHGYAVGVFYGDAALYFPAFLRLLGFSVQTAYKFFIGAVNLGTIVIAYFSFRRMFQSRSLGILGSMLCSLNFYRMLDVYRRAAIGECLGIMFFPLVLLSFYLLFMETNEKNWKKHALLIAFSLTGLVQSHVLSCEMAFVLIFLTCLILIKRVFQKYVLFTLTSAAVLTVLLNLGFLVPFLDFYNDEILIGSSEWVGCTVKDNLQAAGLDLIQIFTLIDKTADPKLTLSGKYPLPEYGIGIVFGIGILLFLILLIFQFKKCCRDKNFYPAILCFTLGCAMLFMSSNLFPWDTLAATGSIPEKLCYSLEFPWRLLAPGATLLSFTICYAVSFLRRHINIYAAAITAVFLTALLLMNCIWFISGKSHTSAVLYIYATEDLDTMLLSTNDYLPTVTDPDEIEEGWLNLSEITSLDAYTKRGTEIQCRVAAGEKGGFIDFPLNYYRYYSCTADSGQSLAVSSGINGMLRVTFPASFEGNILITFKEPLHWRMAECISLLAGLGSLTALILILKKAS